MTSAPVVLPRAATRLAAGATLLALLLAPGWLAAFPASEKASLSLTPDRASYAPGDPVRIAAVMTIEEGWHTNSHQPTFEYLIPTQLEVGLPLGWGEAEIGYPQPEIETFTFAEEPLSVFQGRAVMVASFRVPEGASGPVTVGATLTYQACNDTQCLPPVTAEASVELILGATGAPVAADLFAPARGDGESSAEGMTPASGRGLFGFLVLGVLGGLILNAMPCVLPVLSIKVFALVQSAALSRREVVRSGLATAAGILISFWLLAGAAIGARAAGQAVGWGVQFQEPTFVAFLAVVVVLFTLNMWGLFEIQLPGRLAQVAGQGPQEGIGGHIASGFFATLMATPCSAPFLGTAVGFALAQPPATILGIFTAVGFGMALPYLALATWPGVARLFPRPGAWMVRLKEVMGFLLAGAAIWLFYVLAAQLSAERLAVIELMLLVLALAVWLARSLQGALGRRLAMLGVVAAAIATLGVAATAPPAVADADTPTGGHIEWIAFDRQEAEGLAAEGTPVFVDVTADWCFTCKVNERFVLDTAEVAEAFRTAGVVAMQADWTNRSEEIGTFLSEHGRFGIPFYLLYRPGQESFVFGELLTKEAIHRALASLER